ncbi:MAG TPA: SRPBCC domain-containing protein [Streptosporangiaceae bacterium]|jgi:carbon monoxide dehydrogenase subunit G|nr:SRPBCC domain-containing protein [Streptosporangiaceae bacterium]
MELEHSFSVPVPVERAWDVLQDVERVAPCMPGATLDSVDGDSISGKIKVKVGPIQMTYAGTAKFTERDKAAGVMTLEASGKETRGAGTASASVRSELKADGDKTNVIVHTTLNVTGKPAQFGRGVLVEVGGRLIGIFADNLAAMVTADQAASASATGPASSAAAVSSAPDEVGSDAGSTAPAEGGSSAGGAVEEALPIDVLNLSSRAWSSLRQDGIQTLGDLTRRTEQQLRAIDNIGPASLSDIKRKLADRGLALADSGDKQVATATTAVAADANGTRPAAGKHAGAEDLAEVTPLRPARHESPSAPADRDDQPAWQPPNNEAIDLLGVAGLPVLKRAVPAAAGLLALLLVLLGIKRRRGRHRSQ